MGASMPDVQGGGHERESAMSRSIVKSRDPGGGAPGRAKARRWVGATCAAACVIVGAYLALVSPSRRGERSPVDLTADSQAENVTRCSPPPVPASVAGVGAGTLGAPPAAPVTAQIDPRRSLADAVSSANVTEARRLVDQLSCEDDFPDLVRAVWSPSIDGAIVVVLLYGLAQWSNDDRAADGCRLAPNDFRPGTIMRERSDRRIGDVLEGISADLMTRKELREDVVNALLQVCAARVGLESIALQEYMGPGQTEQRAIRFLDALLVRRLEPSLVPVVTEMVRSGRHKLRERAWRVLVAWDTRAVEEILESPQDQGAPLLDECTRLSALFGRGEADCWSPPPETLSRGSRRFCLALPRIDLDSPASGLHEAVLSTERALHAIAEAYATRRREVGAPVAECVLALFSTGVLLVNTGAEAELAAYFPSSESWFPELFESPSLGGCPTPVLGLIARVASRLSTDDSARRRQAARLEDILARREVSRDEKEKMLAPYR